MLQMLAAVAEMERDLLVERTQSGLARAKREGKVLGRPVKTTPSQQPRLSICEKTAHPLVRCLVFTGSLGQRLCG